MKILLLLYFPRSGSTFFASLLSRYFGNILVLPELRLPYLLALHDMKPGVSIKSQLLDLVKRDYQFPVLGLSTREVEECIDEMDGYSEETFLLQLAKKLARKKNINPEFVLYKCSEVLHYWPSTREKLPTAKFIHIFRDGRATVSSAINTERPYQPGQKMGRGDAWNQSKQWGKYVSRIAGLQSQGEPVFEYQYEQLCDRPLQVLTSFASDVGLSVAPEPGQDLEISPREQGIHENANKAPISERKEGWKKELFAWQGIVSEYLIGDELQRRGYQLFYSTRYNAFQRVSGIIFGYFCHLFLTLVFYLVVFRKGIFQPREFINLVRFRIRRHKLRS